MRHRLPLNFLSLFSFLIAFLLIGRGQAVAQQSTIQALAPYALTVYASPDRQAHIVGVLTPKAKVMLEARTADAAWVLGHNADGSVRGWIETQRLTLPSETSVPRLLVSSETIFVPHAHQPERGLHDG
ncbi:MAG: hypothetical protein KatS3mg051_0772 [Anaerolineae bacterium]|nr:MAG: hypothetical protein KatS3mg051_0772 [Anaerolineae bacterium]